ncbi:T-cell surface antigen CD2 isoform 1-T1 [Anomaloglossus baeobatrachus]|uniref:T-cell surface antigen CD2 n=1 Tax=Anomaloglossus baeobatrachus TaxID=238106 RepID=UPI003F503AB7
MEVQGSVRLFPWTRLGYILLLSGMVEIRGAEIYIVPGHPLILNVPNCEQLSDSDSIEWEDEAIRLGKWKKMPTYYNYCNATLCTAHPNGSLTIQKPKEKTTIYRVKVYSSTGTRKCYNNVSVIVEEMLPPPILSYNCTSAGTYIYCATSAQNRANLTLSWGSKLQTTEEKSIAKTIKEQNGPLSCVVRNRAQQSENTETINCTGWDLYLIVSVAGGGVALIIFIALVVYSVKYKPWRSRGRTDEDVEMNRPQPYNIQGPLQPPTGLEGPGPLSSGIQGDRTEEGLIQKPPAPHRQEEPTPGGKKGKQKRSRRLPPPAPGQTTTSQTTPAPQQSRPALPGNHPSEQAPRPQPRTMSKPPRQSRKSRH